MLMNLQADPGPLTSTPNKSCMLSGLENGSISTDSPQPDSSPAHTYSFNNSSALDQVELSSTSENTRTGSPKTATSMTADSSNIVQNKPKVHSDELKRRLLIALSDLIPHREHLSLRMLITYKIDDNESECLMIDETLCGQQHANRPASSETKRKAVLDQPYMDEHASSSGKRRKQEERSRVLDLSVHNGVDESDSDVPLKIVLDTNRDKQPTAELNGARQSETSSNMKSTGSKAVSQCAESKNAAEFISSSQTNGSSLFTSSDLPVLDSSIFALLPFLQQQQQQNPTSTFNSSKSSSAVDSINLNPSMLQSNAAGAMLFNELQALMQNNVAAHLGNSPALNPIGSQLLKSSFESNGSGLTSTASLLSNTMTTNVSCSALNAGTNAQSLFTGFPLFTPFGSADQLTTVQALLPTTQLFTPSLSTPAFSSFNLGSATLLNLKDKTTGLETVGIMPAAKQLTQPFANILNQFNSQQTNSVSLRTLSQLLNNQAAAAAAAMDSQNIINNNNNTQLPTGNAVGGFMSTTCPNDRRHSTTETTITDVKPHIPLADSSVASSTEQQHNSNGPAGFQNNNGTQFMFGRRLTHTRRFTCNQCRKNFASLAELNRHTLESHNSFKCTICSAHFTQRSNLQRHSLKHVGFKPFTCNLCKKEYYRKDHLVRHIEVTHPNHDPKMNITVHLTSSECLDYLDRINVGKHTPSPESLDAQQTQGSKILDRCLEECTKIEEPSTELNEFAILDTPNTSVEVNQMNTSPC